MSNTIDLPGGQEIVLSTLQNPEPWKKTGRWDDTKVDKASVAEVNIVRPRVTNPWSRISSDGTYK